MRIAYLHGLESQVSPQDPKIQFLNEVAIAVWAPQIDYHDPQVFNTLLEGISTFKPDLIIGSSMGGWMAYLIGNATGTQTLLYNPAVTCRSFSPPVTQTPTLLTHHTLMLGKQDTIIPSVQITQWFAQQAQPYQVNQYPDGHRVPVQVFRQSIQDLIQNQNR